jgi:hypothetical protein
MKFFLRLVLSLVLLVSMISPVLASNSENLNIFVNVVGKEDSINLSWNLPGKSFAIKDPDGKFIYDGNKKAFKHNGLEAGSLNRYQILAYNDLGDVIDIINVSTFTKKSETINDESELDQDLTTTVIALQDQVKISWNKIVNVNSYEVYKDGEKISDTQKNIFIDNNVVSDKEYRYEIRFTLPMTKQEKQQVKDSLKKNKVEVNDSELDYLTTKEYSIVKFVTTPVISPQSDQVSIMGAASSNRQYALAYTCFIAADYVKDPWYNAKTWGDGISWFGGDNRGFDPNSSKYRTRSLANTTFSTNATTPSNSFFKYIGTTTAYDNNKVFVSSAVDQAHSIKQSIWYYDDNQVNYAVSHASKNPYAYSGSEIDYYYRAELNSNGSYLVYGKHDRAPNHEFYLTTGGARKILFQFVNEGFEYLVSNDTARRSFSVSN